MKYYLTYEQGRKPLEGHFQIKDSSKKYKHTFETANLAKMLHGLKEGKVDFTLKKKKFFGANNLETQSVQLTSLGAHSVMEKHIALLGARLTCRVMIRKSTRTTEFEKVPGKQRTLGPIPPPFKTLEE